MTTTSSEPTTRTTAVTAACSATNNTTPSSAAATADAPEGWTLDKDGLKKLLTFDDFKQALAYVVLVGKKAEAADHHPDVDIRWNKVTLRLITHSKGMVTDSDFEMARELNKVNLEEAKELASTLLT